MNIKGHVKVELMDPATGKILKKSENHNLVTNALNYFFKQGGITNPSAFYAQAIRTDALNQLFGGMMCFDAAISENAETVQVPAGVGMTANGARGILNSGAPIELGSYNETESGLQQDGSLKMVWDFSTSQGNGVVASVGLTSLYAGMKGIGNKSKTSKANSYDPGNYNSLIGSLSGISGTPVGLYNNRIYSVQAVTGVDRWTVKIYDAIYKRTDIRNTMTAREVDEIEVSIPSAIQNLRAADGGSDTQPVYGAMRQIYQKGSHAYILLICSEGSYVAAYWREYFSDANPWYAIDYDMATGAVSVVTLNPSTTGVPALTTASGQNYLAGITDKWAIIGATAINKANLAEAVTIENAPEGTSDYTQRTLTAYGTDILEGGGLRYDIAAERALPVNGGHIGGIGSLQDNPLFRFTGSSILRDYTYLATIYNLEEPVTKTADKTMKVTYILSFTN